MKNHLKIMWYGSICLFASISCVKPEPTPTVSNYSNIEGIWINYANLSGGLANITWNWKLFFPNGKSLQAIPSEGLYQYNIANEVNLNVGTYSFANGNGTNYKYPQQNSPDIIKSIGTDKLEIDGIVYLKCKQITGQYFAGAFTSFANPNDPALDAMPTGQKAKIWFNTDGKFLDEGIHTFFLKDYTQSEAYNAAGAGTYELKDYSIILKYDDGRIKQEAFTCPFSNSVQTSEIIFISRGQLNLIK